MEGRQLLRSSSSGTVMMTTIFFNSCEPSTMGRLKAFLSAFRMSQAGVPATSITFTRIVVDDLSSAENDFLDPSSRKKLFST